MPNGCPKPVNPPHHSDRAGPCAYAKQHSRIRSPIYLRRGTKKKNKQSTGHPSSPLRRLTTHANAILLEAWLISFQCVHGLCSLCQPDGQITALARPLYKAEGTIRAMHDPRITRTRGTVAFPAAHLTSLESVGQRHGQAGRERRGRRKRRGSLARASRSILPPAALRVKCSMLLDYPPCASRSPFSGQCMPGGCPSRVMVTSRASSRITRADSGNSFALIWLFFVASSPFDQGTGIVTGGSFECMFIKAGLRHCSPTECNKADPAAQSSSQAIYIYIDRYIRDRDAVANERGAASPRQPLYIMHFQHLPAVPPRDLVHIGRSSRQGLALAQP